MYPANGNGNGLGQIKIAFRRGFIDQPEPVTEGTVPFITPPGPGVPPPPMPEPEIIDVEPNGGPSIHVYRPDVDPRIGRNGMTTMPVRPPVIVPTPGPLPGGNISIAGFSVPLLVLLGGGLLVGMMFMGGRR